jgi:hypothetical protein
MLPPDLRTEHMCAKCKEFDRKIAHYVGLAARMTDQRMLDGIKRLIAQASTEKSELHFEDAK